MCIATAEVLPKCCIEQPLFLSGLLSFLLVSPLIVSFGIRSPNRVFTVWNKRQRDSQSYGEKMSNRRWRLERG